MTTKKVLLIGCPGVGKTMVARRVANWLTAPPEKDLVALAWIYTRLDREQLWTPFRAPHHTVSETAMIGWQSRSSGTIRPGELSLAHSGVLFLDEVTEFRCSVLESIQTTVESGVVRLLDAKVPAAPRMLIGAMNPCPCGYRGYPTRTCMCSEAMVERYVQRAKVIRWDEVHFIPLPIGTGESATRFAQEIVDDA